MNYEKIKSVLDRGLKKEIIELFEYLKQYDNAYYNDGTKLITDTEYDRLKSTLKRMFPQNPYWATVGAPVVGDKKVALPYILGSLDKVGPDDIEKWLNKQNTTIIATEKLDGASIFVKWVDGNVVLAATRGDGKTGQNITDKAQYFIPNIPVDGTVELRGEALLIGTDHKELGMKNRRNGVAGLLNREDYDPEDVKKIHVKFYELINAPVELDEEIYRLKYIEMELGLSIPRYAIGKTSTLINTMNDMIRYAKEDGTYDVDGMVLTVNNSQRQNVMIPSNKVAYKVNEEAVKVVVTGVEWNVSKGGKLIPTVLIEPTEISGSTITRTTGFNAEFIFDNDIGMGAVIGLVKAGDVIPYITEVFEPAKETELLTGCPSCGGEIGWKGVDIVCINPDECEDSQIKKTAFFFKKMGSDYITETTIRNLGITSIEEAYDLDELEIADMEGFGIKKAEQIVYEIQKTLKTTPETLLAAFSIEGIGESVATQIMGAVDGFENLFEINNLEGVIGPKTEEKFINGIQQYKNLYSFLVSRGLKFKEKVMGTLQGKKVALTGTGPMKRNELTKMIQLQGGTVGTVSKATDILVCEDPYSGSAKLKKAEKYGTKIIGYDELLEMIQ